MEKFPSEILNLIADHLSFRDKFHLAKSNKWIYDCIWTPVDINKTYDNLMLLILTNLYSSILCENKKDIYLMLPFVIHSTEYENVIRIGLSFHENSLYVNFIRYSSKICDEIVNKITKVDELNFLREETHHQNSSLHIKYSKLIVETDSCSKVEMIHYNVMKLIHMFQMVYYIPMYNEYYDIPETLFEILFRHVDNVSDLSNLQIYLHNARNYDKDYYSYVYKTKGKTDILAEKNVALTQTLFLDLNSIFAKFNYTDKHRFVSKFSLNQPIS
jgi:hypothetical protein